MTYTLQNIRFFNRSKMCAVVEFIEEIRNNGRTFNKFCSTNIILTFAVLPNVRNWKRVRVAEGARLESVCMGNCTVSSNLTVSANKKRPVSFKTRRDVFCLSCHDYRGMNYKVFPLKTPREITMRCTSEVPSYICVIFASRINRST